MTTRLPWSKFEWQKWEAEPTLKLCSLGAQGLWMRLLCVMAQEDGYLLVNGRAPSVVAISARARVIWPCHPKDGRRAGIRSRELRNAVAPLSSDWTAFNPAVIQPKTRSRSPPACDRFH